MACGNQRGFAINMNNIVTNLGLLHKLMQKQQTQCLNNIPAVLIQIYDIVDCFG